MSLTSGPSAESHSPQGEPNEFLLLRLATRGRLSIIEPQHREAHKPHGPREQPKGTRQTPSMCARGAS